MHAPAVVDEAFHHVGRKRERGTGPQVFVVIRAFHFFNVVEAAHRHGVRAIRQATQHAWHHQAEIAGIVGLTERFPFNVLSAIEVVTDVFDGRHFFHRLFMEELRPCGADKRHVGSSGNF
ncbi:hypothetical protein D3C73_1418110 [compost metagenome]